MNVRKRTSGISDISGGITNVQSLSTIWKQIGNCQKRIRRKFVSFSKISQKKARNETEENYESLELSANSRPLYVPVYLIDGTKYALTTS
ncbi:hypothetical protein SNEBB_008453 [Seison nebaliae]|nr:hypothetical protein SNEBB_008453 [Seison nebaliae]